MTVTRQWAERTRLNSHLDRMEAGEAAQEAAREENERRHDEMMKDLRDLIIAGSKVPTELMEEIVELRQELGIEEQA